MYCTSEFPFGVFAFHGHENNDRRLNTHVSFPDHPLLVGYLGTLGIRHMYNVLLMLLCHSILKCGTVVLKWTNFSGSAILGILTTCCAKMANTQNLTHALLERWNWYGTIISDTLVQEIANAQLIKSYWIKHLKIWLEGYSRMLVNYHEITNEKSKCYVHWLVKE